MAERCATVAERFEVFPGRAGVELVEVVTRSSEIVRAIVNVLRRAPGVGFTAERLATETGFGEHQIDGALSGVARRCPDHPLAGERVFPWHVLVAAHEGRALHTWAALPPWPKAGRTPLR